MAAHAAIEALFERHPEGSILILSDEKALPRISTESEDGSPGLDNAGLLRAYDEWRRHVSSRLEAEPDAFSQRPLTLRMGRRNMHFDVENRTILLHDGTSVTYDKCLLANAGQAKEVPVLRPR